MYLRSEQQASLLNLISKYQTATAAEATTAFQTWCLANSKLLTDLLKEALIESGIGRSDAGNGAVSTYFALVESGIKETLTFTPGSLTAADAAALKVVMETAGNIDTAAHAIVSLQDWSLTDGSENGFLNQILYQGILATGAYGLTGGVVPDAVKTYVDLVCTAFSAAETFTPAITAAEDAVALKAVVDATYATPKLAIEALQGWAAPGTPPAGVEPTPKLLNPLLSQAILASGAYGLTGGAVPAAVTTFVNKACTGLAQTTVLGDNGA